MLGKGLQRAAFLDRDGVLNACSVDHHGVPHPPVTADDTCLLPGVAEACGRLRQAGYLLICVTNQPDVARGTQTRQRVEAINAKLMSLLKLDAVYVCYHDNEDQCDCRKPRPGMLLTAAREHEIDLSRSIMVGDRAGDILAGAAAGVKTFLLHMPYSKADQCRPDISVQSLAEVADAVLSNSEAGR